MWLLGDFACGLRSTLRGFGLVPDVLAVDVLRARDVVSERHRLRFPSRQLVSAHSKLSSHDGRTPKVDETRAGRDTFSGS